MLSMFDLTCLAFCEVGDDGFFTKETAVTFSVASVNPDVASWNNPRKELWVVYNFITVSCTQTQAVSAEYPRTIVAQTSQSLAACSFKSGLTIRWNVYPRGAACKRS